MSEIRFKEDTLAALNDNIPVSEKLERIHAVVRSRHPFIERIAVALHDAKTDLLKTFIHSSGGEQPLCHYQAKLAEAPSLQDVVASGKPRVINDLRMLAESRKVHSQRLLSQGYGASYTLPMYRNGEFFGLIFFNSYEKGVMDAPVLHDLDIFAHLLSLLVISEMESFRTLLAAVKTASDITHHRDYETGTHLDRMSRYSRIIALELAPQYGFSDEFVEQVFMFSPLHDIGKIGIPDEILLKRGALTADEYEIMKRHPEKGRLIIDAMLENFELADFHHIDVLRNIAEFHHETLNGSGYPKGLRGDAIPIEARIVAVADIFDALTSQRPYKEAWSNEKAIELLRRLAGDQLDADCVEALIRNREKVEQIQRRFAEDTFG